MSWIFEATIRFDAVERRPRSGVWGKAVLSTQHSLTPVAGASRDRARKLWTRQAVTGQVSFPRVVLVAAAVAANVLGLGTGVAGSTTTMSAATTSSALPVVGPVAKHPKLDSQLLATGTAAEGIGGVADGLRVAREHGLALSGNSIRVVVTGASGRSAARLAIGTVGGRVDGEYANLVQAYVPVVALRKLADLAIVSYVGLPAVPIADAVTDEAVAATSANVWQGAGLSGAGVKVGIIDLGFIGYTTSQATGDLPSSVTTADFGCGGVATGTNHGTAVGGIVYKMAPGAQLYLICVATNVSLGQAKDYAIAQGIRIVNHSVGWFNTSRGDGTGAAGSPDAIAADARAHGILWVNAAGNSSQRHWSGTFVDTNANLWHEFAPGNELDDIGLAAGGGVCVFLKWDSWPTTMQDFDLYLFRLADLSGPVASSTNVQNGSQSPTEEFCYTNTTGVGQLFGIAIRKFAATATPRFDLFVDRGAPQYVVTAGSVVEPASSPSTMAAGAICFSTNVLEPYSSQGPTIDGRIKPDIAGQDATSSPVYGAGSCAGSGGIGSGGFTGTSASSPHVAGAAALVAQANPTFTVAQLQSFLEGRAIDLGASGKDNLFGAGELSLGPVPPPTVSGISPTSGPAGGGTTVTINGTGFATAAGATTVKFGANAGTGVSCASATNCTATSPAGSGRVDVGVTVAGLASAPSAADQFTYAGTTFDDMSPSVTYSGSWSRWFDPGNYGGSVAQSPTTGSQASFGFSGSFVTLIYLRYTDAGIATVAIDGSTVDSLDMYGAPAFQRQKTYATSAGTHTITVTVSGSKNASASATWIYVDGFTVQ